MSDLELQQSKTIEDFGAQWTAYTANEKFYGSVDLLLDIVSPFLGESDIADRRCADIGAGTGRITAMLLEAGAAHVTAIEPSDAFHVLARNVKKYGDRVTCVHGRGEEIPRGDFDLVVSIGVIHHIPDPKPVIEAARDALRDGGRILIWLYGAEGSRLYRALFQPARLVTRRLPLKWNAAIAGLLYPFTMLYGQFATRLGFLPLHDYMKNVYFKFDPEVRKLVIVDQINPRWAKYYRRDEAEQLLRECGFVDVKSHHRRNYSWTVTGTKRP